MVIAAALLFTGSSHAFDRVVVLSDPDMTLSVRLQAELTSLGVDSVVQPVPEDTSPEALESIAHEAEALATILLVGKDRVVEIWIADRTTGKTVLRRIPIQPGSASDDTAVTKTVELLRASLLEVRIQTPEAPLPPVVEKLIGPRVTPPVKERRLVTLRLGPAIAFGAGGLPPSAQIDADIVVAPVELVAVGVSLSIPTVPSSFDVAEGEISRTQFWATGIVELHPVRGAVVDPRLGLGVGAEIANGEGDTTSPNEGRSSVTAAALGLLEVGMAVPLTEVVALDGEIDCGVTLPRTDYLVLGNVVGSAGWPSCTATVGIGLSL